jgi:SH3-like domain-containing protein
MRAPGLALAAMLAVAPQAASAEMRSVTVTSANFRAGPSTREPVLFTADRHYPVEILEAQGDWVRVRDFEGEEAWVSTLLLGDEPAVVVTADVVNVREKPARDAVVVHTAERGAVFRVLARQAGWVSVADEAGAVGWVHENLLWGNLASAP